MFVLLAVLLAAEPLVATDPPATSRLTLQVNSGKTTFTQYEYVVVRYEIRNSTSEPITTVLDPIGGVRWFATDTEGNTRTQHGLEPLMVDSIVGESTYEAGSISAFVAELGERLFPAPGEYTLRARLAASGEVGVSLESNDLRIQVREPSGVDAAAIAYFPSKEQFQLLIRGGAGKFCRGRVAMECLEELLQFVEKHGKSAYAPQVVWNLANAVGAGRLGEKAHHDLAVGLYRQFLEQWNDHLDAPKVMYGLAMTLDHAGRYGEATAVIEECERRFPADGNLASLLRGNLESGKMLGPRATP